MRQTRQTKNNDQENCVPWVPQDPEGVFPSWSRQANNAKASNCDLESIADEFLRVTVTGSTSCFCVHSELIRKRAIYADWLPKSPTRHAVRLDDPSKILQHDKVEVIGCRATSVLPGTS